MFSSKSAMGRFIPDKTMKIAKKQTNKQNQKYSPVPLQVHILVDTSLSLLFAFQKGGVYLKSKNIYIIIFLLQH